MRTANDNRAALRTSVILAVALVVLALVVAALVVAALVVPSAVIAVLVAALAASTLVIATTCDGGLVGRPHRVGVLLRGVRSKRAEGVAGAVAEGIDVEVVLGHARVVLGNTRSCVSGPGLLGEPVGARSKQNSRADCEIDVRDRGRPGDHL